MRPNDDDVQTHVAFGSTQGLPLGVQGDSCMLEFVCRKVSFDWKIMVAQSPAGF
jgi:hypothetical protein